MKRLQFSIVFLLGLVTFVSIGCAALVNASELWAAVVVNATVLALMAASLASLYWRSGRREFFGGFAIFGWTYLLLATSSLFNVEQWLLTGAANDYLYSLLAEPEAQPGAYAYAAPAYRDSLIVAPSLQAAVQLSPAPVIPGMPPPGASMYSTYVTAFAQQAPNTIPYDAFESIGHSLWAILLGLAGGALATLLVSRSRTGGSSSD
jgi:hypothetical protein